MNWFECNSEAIPHGLPPAERQRVEEPVAPGPIGDLQDLLGVAALVALVNDPLVLVEPGFQLSFAGFSGLGAGAAVWQGGTMGRAGSGRAAGGLLQHLPRGARRRLKLIGLAMAGAWLTILN